MTKPGPSVTSGADIQPGSDSLFPSGFGGGAAIRTGGVGTGEIADASVAAADLNLPSVAAALAARGEFTGIYGQLTDILPPGQRLAQARPDIVVERWQSGHGWTTSGSKITASDDATDYVFGAQSFKAVMNGAASSFGLVQKTYGADVDFTGRQVGLWLKVDDMPNTVNLTIYMGDSAFTNYFQATVMGVRDELRQVGKSGEWFLLAVPWSYFGTGAGTPNRATIRQVRIAFGDLTTGVSTTWRLGALWAIPETATFPNGVVSLTFDDSDVSLWPTVRPKLDQYGYQGVVFPTMDAIGSTVTLAQLKQLQAEGWEIASHASGAAGHVDHNGLTQAQRLAEYQTIKRYNRDNGFHSDSFAWPNGRFDAAAASDSARYFTFARGLMSDQVETLPPAAPQRLRSYNVTGVSLATLQGYIDKAKSGKGWAIFTFHSVNAGGTGNNPMTTANFNSLIDYINTQGVPVRTFSQIARSLAA